jgi:hypothetical protein
MICLLIYNVVDLSQTKLPRGVMVSLLTYNVVDLKQTTLVV